jgi:hypothetical protein
VGIMVVNTVFTFAFKCSQCGSYSFFDISYFNMEIKGEINLRCRCGGSQATVNMLKRGRIAFSVPCIGCGDMHEYMASRKELRDSGLLVCRCKNSGIQHCFAGSDDNVRKRIDILEDELERLMDELGYERYFINSQVMLESINRIHEMAEKGQLYCRCGSNDIEVVLLEDKIFLKCRSCPGKTTICASSNKDLEKILMNRAVLLS